MMLMTPKVLNCAAPHALMQSARKLLNGLVVCGLGLIGLPVDAWATDYNVGPNQGLATIGEVPWYKLKPGDNVFIHYKPSPYHEKFLISTRGTASRWIRVVGVPGPGGELPIVSGKDATTSANMRYHWPSASGSSAIQHLGVVQIAAGAGEDAPLPAYIEIANLRIQDGFKTNQFTAENGVRANFDAFAACIYARSVQHLIIRNNILTNCGQGFYNWTGSGTKWWDGLQMDTVVGGNYFYNNGNPGSYTEHQSYTESDGVTYEYNRFGRMRAGAMGSQLKDRSAGTVIRYNYIEASPSGWMMDLVEPENAYEALGSKATYKQAFVYGNLMISRGATINGPNLVHWNEDHQRGVGRAVRPDSKLFFYHNTISVVANRADFYSLHVFNTTWGGYDCPTARLAGVIDIRNNIFALVPRTSGASVPGFKFAYCRSTNLAFGSNWVSPGWVSGTSENISGTGNLVSPANNSPGFVGPTDLHLTSGSSATGIGSPLAAEVLNNGLRQSFEPSHQYVEHQQVTTRARSGAGSDVGAFESGSRGGASPSRRQRP
jgi:hypothetical protein